MSEILLIDDSELLQPMLTPEFLRSQGWTEEEIEKAIQVNAASEAKKIIGSGPPANSGKAFA